MRAAKKNGSRSIYTASLWSVVLFFLSLPFAAAQAQSVPSDTTSFPVTAGTQVYAGGGWATLPTPPACTPTQASTTVALVAPKYGTLAYQVQNLPVGAGQPCAGTVIPWTFTQYTWNRTGPGNGHDYFRTETGNDPSTISDFAPILTTGIDSKLLGKPNQCTHDCAADPVSILSGNMFYSAPDYSTAGANPLSFTRYYNSRSPVGASTFATTLGVGWRSNFDRYINITSTNYVTVERPDGQQVYFTFNGAQWVPDLDVDITLTKSGSTWTLTDHDDTVETYTTTSAGNEALLGSIKARNGYTQTLSYNGSNQLASVSDSYGRPLTFTYSGGLLSSVATTDFTTISYGYTTSGGTTLLSTVSYPTSPTSTVTYHYGENSAPATALTSILDEKGNTYSSWTYDQYSRATQSQLGNGANLTTIGYVDDGSFTRTVTNAFGVKDTYNYFLYQGQGTPKLSGIDRASTSTTASGATSYNFDSHGYLYSFDDWNHNITKYTNNSHGDPTTIIEAFNNSVSRTTTITYDTTWVHQPKTIVTPGLTTSFTYDANGNPLTKTLTDTTSTSIPYSTSGQARTWTYTYDSTGRVLTAQTPRTDVTATTTLGYSGGTLISVTDALGHVTNVTGSQSGGLPQKIVDPNTVTRVFSWDARQRLVYDVAYTGAGNYTTYYNRDPIGELTQILLPDTTYRNFTYDTAHRLTKISDPFSSFVATTLDALGNTTQAQTANGSTVYKNHTATFDALGRKLTDVGGQGQTTTLTYDSNGNALTVKDGLNQNTTRVFDALNRLSKSTDANSGVAQWTYDAHDRPLTVVDQNSHTTSYVYDGFGDVIQQTSPDTGTTVYHYDNNGNLTSKTDALAVVTNQTFDKLDRPLTTTYPADATLNVAYTYDQTGTGFSFGIGRLTSVTDQAGSLTRAYDERGNLLSERRVSGGNAYTTSYAYNSGNRLHSTTYPDGTVVIYLHDAPGNVNVVQATPAGGSAITLASSIDHLPFGPLKYIAFGNGMTETWFNDLDYRVTSLTSNLGSINTQAVMHFDYAFDAANNLKTITDHVNAGNSQTLTYDVLNRLNTATSGTGGYGSLTYTFDPVGNLSSLKIGSATTNYTYAGGTNQLSAIGATSVTTNANGNITGAPIVGGTSAATYSYSAANRLSGASGGGISTAITGITYDAFGKRFSKAHATGSPILYFYDQYGQVIAENNGGAYTDYAYVDGIPLAVIQPGATPAANQINYVSTDRLGAPQVVSNNAQATVWSNTYQPFGQGGNPTSAITNNIRLPGQDYDKETGFHYNLFRDYMPNIGRYLEADPIGTNGGLNSYAYANGNPSSFVDRLGLASGNPYDDIADRIVGIGGHCPYGPCSTTKETPVREDAIKALDWLSTGATATGVGGFALGQGEVAGPAFVVGVCAEGLKKLLEKGGNPGTGPALDYGVKAAASEDSGLGAAIDSAKLMIKFFTSVFPPP